MNPVQFPKKIQITDVGPRDGFQNVKTFIGTDKKLVIIDSLVEAGIRSIEITSFVNPKAIPQMADAAEVAETVRKMYPDLKAIALVPNLRGAENAVKAGIREVAYVISASEAHNMANVRRTIQESVDNLTELVKTYPDLHVRLDIATAFGCPYSGTTPAENVISLMRAAGLLGIHEVTLCDTIGVANPAQVAELLTRVKAEVPDTDITLHLHNTRGIALANMIAAMQCGVTAFETSIGGLGGCPFAPGSEGNAATEDTVYMLEAMGIDTGINLDKLLGAVAYVQENVDAPITGKMLKVKNSSCSNISGKAE